MVLTHIMEMIDGRSALVALGGLVGGALVLVLARPIQTWRLRTLPGPPALPMMGNLLSIMKMPGGFAFWRDAMQKKYGKVYKIWMGSDPGVVISDPHILRKITAATNQRPDMETFFTLTGENHYVVLNGLFFLSPEQHGHKFRAMRKAFETAVMSPTSLKGHEPMIQECIARLLARLDRYAQSGEPIEICATFSDMTMNVIGFAAFGVDLHSIGAQDTRSQMDKQVAAGKDPLSSHWLTKPGTPEFGYKLTDIARTIFRMSDPAEGSPWKLPSRFFPELHPLVQQVACAFPDSRLRKEIQARSDMSVALRILMQQWKDHKNSVHAGDTTTPLPATSDQGFLAKLLDAAQTEGFSELDVIAQAVMMLLAGYETTASNLSTVMHLLMQHPKQLAQLHHEVDTVLQGKTPTAEDLDNLPYVKAVIDEALRLYTPGDVLQRTLKEDMVLEDGKVIPAGVPLWLPVRSLLIDPSIWPRAEEFVPERWLPGNEHLVPNKELAYLPFGGGARMCPGYKLALLEARLALARIMQHYTFTPAPGCTETKWNSGFVLSPTCVWLQVARRERALEPAGLQGSGTAAA